MRVTYDGPIDVVELPQLHNVVVQRGETISVSDELGAQLIQQSCWSEEKPTAKPSQKKEG